MALPKISVVTPSFNQAAFVEDAVTSVIGQNYDNLEYVVIDGGSTDGSDTIIRRYQNHLHYYVSEPDTGHGNAINKGFRQTTGEIMAWLNSDDKYMPWTLRTVAEIFAAHPDINWITGTQGFWNANGALIYSNNVYKNAADFLGGNYAWIQQESVFWRRSLWDNAGGYVDESYRFMVDGELWCRFFALDRLWHVSCILSGYRVHAGNRAKRFRQECLAEMNRAIEAMRVRVDPRKLTAAELNYPLLAYDFENSAWTKRVLPKDFNKRQ